MPDDLARLETPALDDLSWGAALPPDVILVARCPRCAAASPAPPWVAEALRAQASLTRLEDQLRCACGARSGRLAALPAANFGVAEPGAVFVFGP